MKSILKSYRRRLLNLSSSNRALVLMRLSKELHLDMQELDFLHNKTTFELIQQLTSARKKITLCTYADSRYEPVTPVSRSLRNIRRKADLIFEERGSKELYVGWPFVHGQFPDGTVARCPLLFFPVKLQVNSLQEWELIPDDTQAAQFNQSFLLAYAHYMGTPLAEPLAELDLQTLPNDALAFRTAIYELLKEHQVAIHAGREFFADRIKHFIDYRKADFEKITKPGQLYLEQEAVLGVFPQAASFLLADYDALIEQGDLQEMEELFASPAESKSSAAPAQHTFTAFAIDASQEAALQKVKQGKSVVVQGPPGTGKSQLICNLISDFTARGKKVLVVSQKRAALTVVHQRLASKGLASFAALVHDINTDRRSIYKQLAEQIEQVDAYRVQNLALNSIYTDRAFLEVSRGINQCTQKLEHFKAILFDASRCGWSPKELYLQSSLLQPHIALGTSFKNFTATNTAKFLPRLQQYLEQAMLFEQDDFILKERYSMKSWGWPERQELEQIIRQAPEVYLQHQQHISQLSGFNSTFKDLPQSIELLTVVEELKELVGQQEVLQMLQPLLRKNVKIRTLTHQVKELQQLYNATVLPDKLIPAADVDDIRITIADYCSRQGHFWQWITWRILSPHKKVLKQALALYKWNLSEEAVAQLQQRLQLRQHAEELMQAINASVNSQLSINQEPAQILAQLETVNKSLAAFTLLRQLHKASFLNKDLYLLRPDLPERLEQLSQRIHCFSLDLDKWKKWLPEVQIQKLLSDQEYAPEMLQQLQQHFEVLVLYDALYASFTAVEKQVIKLLLEQPMQSSTAGVMLFLNSLYLAWLHELEQQQPELRMPSNGELERLENELQKLLHNKNKLSQEIVLSKLREQTYHNIEYNRLGNAITYRRLLAQVVKKRSLYPVRKLFSLFSAEILDLVPCWLASPETVSAVMPLEASFDLVIFDEASQCFAETGIPSIVRGKQVVVAGDEQQLSPSDLYRTRWSAAAADDVEELSAESLLQLCDLYLPQTMLTQHYRSRYPELIEFSNQHFYRRKLELIPDRLEINAGEPAIKFVKVEGVWQQNANVPEAEEVVKQVFHLLSIGQEEIGIITFNYTQQMLVQDLLEDTARRQSINLPAGVLVKNIENIQGDEKEVIILSVGYAPDETGKLVMQFGSLNQAGGENRLNVAVTRARQKVIVVSSILPEQLQVEKALHQGPKLLKAYLQYAQQVSTGNFIYTPKAASFPKHSTLLKENLQQAISALQPMLPFADLTLKQEQVYKGVILTDDDLYFSSFSARHMHADIPQLLRNRHWPFRRIYSRQFWADKETVLQQLLTLTTTHLRNQTKPDTYPWISS